MLFAWHQGFTNDEGAYLYDARTVLEEAGMHSYCFGRGGDALVKTPVVIGLFAVSEFLTHHSLFAGRLVNSIASIAIAWPLFLLLVHISNRKTGYIGIFLWLLGSGPIIFYTIGHTQAVASFFAIAALYMFIVQKRMLTAGILFALAYASRKIELVLVLPIIISYFLYCKNTSRSYKKIGIFFAGLLVVFAIWFAGAWALYGLPGILQASGISYGQLLIHQNISPWAGGMGRMVTVSTHALTPYIVLLIVAYVFVVFELLFKQRFKNKQLLIPISWFSGLVLLYSAWPTLLPEYLGDFLVPSVMIIAMTLGSCMSSRTRSGIHVYPPFWRVDSGSEAGMTIGVLLFLLLSIYSLHDVYKNPWTGMFTREAIMSSSNFFKNTVPYTDKVFTAAVIIPYVSGHHVPFNISHPQWYVYDFVSAEEKNVFLPTYAILAEEISSTSWGIDDQLSDYAYPNMFSQDWHSIRTISNITGYRDNPLRIVERR